MTQVIRTVLEVDASKAVAGFGQGERAVQGYERAVTRAGSSTGATGFDKLTGSIRDNRSAWDQTANSALVGGAALAGGLGLATKAAIDWESAWAGVTKTVDGTPEQYAELEEGLRGLAKTLPATHEELAGVAEAAGQLGVARDDILGFTETAVALGESTNLSAETAAESLAKFSNIMGTASREGVLGYEKMGSALVALGNDGASTEADIMAMSLRLAGAGKQIGATEADILAMANALSSVGIEAELGGGAMSRAMLKMNTAVISGGDELEKFAEISGMSATDFATAWREDPIAATNAFVGGLGRIGESGGDASAALDGVGLAGTQNAQVLLRAAGASDLMTESLELGATAWDENAALAEEAGKRYETTESKLQIAKNTMKDAAIDLGAVFGPVLASGAGKLASLADGFVKLPEPIQKTAGALAGVAASALLLGGGAVKVIGWGQDIGDAFGKITSKGADADGQLTRTGRTMQGMAKWGGYAVGALAVASALGAIAESGYDAQPSIEDTTAAILDLNDAAKGDELAGFFDGLGDNAWIGNHVGDIDNLADAYNRLENPSLDQQFVDWKDNLFPGMSSGAERVEGSFDRMGQSLAGMPADKAAAQFDLMVEAIGGGEDASNRLLELMPAYRDSLTGAANDAKLAGDGATQMGGDLDAMGGDAADAEKAIDDLADAIKGLGDLLLNQRGSARDYQAALDDVAASIKENGRTLDINTEAGRANEAALDDLANSTQEWASAVFSSTQDVDKAQGILDQGREKWLKYADALGMTEPEAKALADTLFTMPTDIAPEFSAPGADDTKEKADGVKDAVFGIPESKIAQISELGASDARSRVLNLNDSIVGLDGKTVLVGEDGAQLAKGRVINLDASILGLKGKTVQVEEIGATPSGDRVVRLDGKIYALNGKTVTVQANVFGEGQVNSLQGAINRMSGRSINVNTYYNEYRSITDMGTYKARAMGGIDGAQPMAEGGFATGYRKQLAGGALKPGIYPTSDAGIWMAEDRRSKWESYIPERPDLRGRAEAILEETANRFGKRVVPMAEGDLRPVGSLMPQPRHFATPAPRVTVQAPAQAQGDVIARMHPADIKAIVAGVQQGAFAGTSLQRTNELATAATTRRGRQR